MLQSYFVESCPVGAVLINADRWTDMTELPMTMQTCQKINTF